MGSADAVWGPPVLFGAEHRRYRLAAGWTQEQVGAALYYTAGQVSMIEGELRTPSEDYARGADRLLGAGGVLVRCWELLYARKARRPRGAPLQHEPEAVTYAREMAGLNKRQLAALVGISEQLMGEIESGRRNATPGNVAKLAAALNCPRVVLERKR